MKKSSYSLIYPEKAYIAYILLMKRQGVNYFLPFNDVFLSLEQIKIFSINYIKQNQDENTIIPAAPIIFPIKLSQKFPLKSEFWDEPTEELTKTERVNNFLTPLENYRFQKLLVTPIRSGERSIFKATYCFKITAKDAEIAFFMTNHFLSLDERAKFAAIYHFEDPFRFELNSGKRIEIDDLPKTVIH